jgi:hypothetical protein
MKRAFLQCLVVLGLSLSMLGTASAQVFSVSLDSKASLSPTKTSGLATGTIFCTRGEVLNINIVIFQTSGKINATGTGSRSIICGEGVQSWTVQFDLLDGTSFKHGPASALVRVVDSDNDVTLLTAGVKL